MTTPATDRIQASELKQEGYYWSSDFLEIVELSGKPNNLKLYRCGDERSNWELRGEFIGPLVSPYKRKKL
jgi:hypothetical protein